MVSKEEAFVIFEERYEYLFVKQYTVFPVKVDQPTLERFYEVFAMYHGHLFYSRIEQSMRALESLYHIIFAILEDLPNRKGSLEEAFYIFIKDDKNFQQMLAYLRSYLTSLSVNRIEALYPKHRDYRQIQHILFDHLPFYIGIYECRKLHEEMIKQLYLKFHLLLFEGGTFVKDEDFEEYLFTPVFSEHIKQNKQRIEKLLIEAGHEQAIYSTLYGYGYGG